MKSSLGRYEERVGRRVADLSAADAAGRIWRRDVTFWGADAARRQSVANRLGWLDAPFLMQERIDELEGFAAHVRLDGFTHAVLLGMGGSSLAPEVLRRSIEPRDGSPHLHVLDTTDPATVRRVADAIDPARTLFFVSSKSGTTIEALTLFAWAWDLVSGAKHGRAGESFVAVTDPGTPLDALARAHGFRHVFVNPPDIGGRYSALSYFGLAPAAVAGVDVARLLDAGTEAAGASKSPESDSLRLGATLGELALAGRDKVTFVLSPQIASFGLWVEQLIAESTGKDGRGIVPVVDEPLGTPRAYGDDRLFVYLRLEADDGGETDAFIGALEAEGHPVITIELDTPYDLGREFFAWEFAVAVAGQIIGVNPFDEPNVQESKDNTARALASLESGAPWREAAAARVHDPHTVDALEKLLASLPPRGYFAIMAFIEPAGHTDEGFAHIRQHVRDTYRVATTLGYGPRFLHSTGQLHKGGPPAGVFLQVIAGGEADLPVPGKPYTFGQLERAQADGDFESLVSHGRPVLRVHLTDISRDLEALHRAIASATGAGAAARR